MLGHRIMFSLPGDSCSSPSVEMLRNRIQNRVFTFDCYDIFGRASDPGQTEALASCIQKVVDNVQEGNDTMYSDNLIMCVHVHAAARV